MAKRLKEIGAKQSSLFTWWKGIGAPKLRLSTGRETECGANNGSSIDTSDLKQPVSAFTVAELGSMLPLYLKGWKWHDLDKGGREYWVFESDEYHAQETADTRAKVLIYLLENELVDFRGKY